MMGSLCPEQGHRSVGKQQCADLRLTPHETVVGHGVREVAMHMIADVAQVKGLQITETVSVGQYQDGHHLAVREVARTV